MKKILIIEDEASIRRVLVKILTEENDQYQVFEAEDGLIGTEMIKKEDFDRLDQLLKEFNFIKYICIDVANGYSELFIHASSTGLPSPKTNPLFNDCVSNRFGILQLEGPNNSPEALTGINVFNPGRLYNLLILSRIRRKEYANFDISTHNTLFIRSSI